MWLNYFYMHQCFLDKAPWIIPSCIVTQEGKVKQDASGVGVSGGSGGGVLSVSVC